ncbi:MFS general substrate transporter [Rickenella mellea]|uniref:MFS general substrate transporter n=1 Tax=Rickenella mellea TaxID=50990 RepID=A0A4Y7QMH9_9AGAM|nr:MFS general substrate transporter [Rickenella mellea]
MQAIMVWGENSGFIPMTCTQKLRSSEHITASDTICPVTEEDIPDGGTRAWLVAFGSSISLVATFGIVNSYGVFQKYYMNTLLSTSSSSTISMIGSVQPFLIYGLGPIVGTFFDAYGTLLLFPLGSCIVVSSLVILSFCQEHQVYQFFLVHGVVFGIGTAMIFNPALTVLGQWFRRKRAFALGIAGAGGSLGGLVLPILLQSLIHRIGFPWAVRVLALTAMVHLVIACLTVRTRIPLKRSTTWRTMIDVQGFRDVQYTLAAVGAFLYFLGFFIPYFYIEVYAIHRGMSEELSAYLPAIVNGFGFIARLVTGVLADKFGVLNLSIPSSFLSGALVLMLWLPARGGTSIVAFSALYGFFSGPFLSLLPAYIASRSPADKFGARLGSIYVGVAFATFTGPVIAGALVPMVTQSNFNKLIVFTGVMLISGGLMLALAHAKTLLEKRRLLPRSTSEDQIHER